MPYPGLVRANNLSDVASPKATWDNLGNGVSYTIGGVTSTVTITGADILAIREISTLDVKHLAYLSGLTSAVQPRLNLLAATTASVTALRDNSLLKASPVSRGNYLITGALDFTSLQINSIAVGSLSSSPFSGASATALIQTESVAIGSNFKINSQAVAGILANPQLAIPIEQDGIYLYMKAGVS